MMNLKGSDLEMELLSLLPVEPVQIELGRRRGALLADLAADLRLGGQQMVIGLIDRLRDRSINIRTFNLLMGDGNGGLISMGRAAQICRSSRRLATAMAEDYVEAREQAEAAAREEAER